jgi:hypothetical protein
MLQIYPNPTDDQLDIALEGYLGGQLMVALRNAQGQILQTQRFHSGAGNAVFKMDVHSLTQGIYWLELMHGSGNIQRKVVKK